MKEFCEGHQRQNFKAPRGGNKSIPYDLWFKGSAFFSPDTYKKHFCQCKYCKTLVVVPFISDSNKNKNRTNK